MLNETISLAELGEPLIASLIVFSAILYLLYSFQQWRPNNLPLLNDTGPFDFLQVKAVNRFRHDARQLIKSGFDSVSLTQKLKRERSRVICSFSDTSTIMFLRCERMSELNYLRLLNMGTSSAITLR